MCHMCEKWLKSVYIYGSYRKIKTGVPLLDHSVDTGNIWLSGISFKKLDETENLVYLSLIHYYHGVMTCF